VDPEWPELRTRGDGPEAVAKALRDERGEAVVLDKRRLAPNDRQDARVSVGWRPERAWREVADH